MGAKDAPVVYDLRSAAKRTAAGGAEFTARAPLVLTRHVFLVGFMGAGKTSVSRRLARNCSIASVDLDAYLERREGRTIRDIFAEDGEEGFRALETEVLGQICAKDDPLVVSCGGGVVQRACNREAMARSGVVVFLKVGADEAASRISNKATRPLLQNIEAARERARERQPLYEEAADFVIDTSGKGVPEIAREVQSRLEKRGVLCRQPR